MLFQNPTIKEILERYRAIWSIDHALSLMGWDAETYMPTEGIKDRALARADLALIQQSLILKQEFLELVAKADKIEDLNDYERGTLRVLNRMIKLAKSLPPSLVAERAKITAEAVIVWREARAKNDFDMFRPYLERIFEISKKIADCLTWEKHPYDALLDLYEEGIKTEDVNAVLGSLRNELKWIVQKVLSEVRYPREHPLERTRYDPSKMQDVNLKILEALGYPQGVRGRLDISAHPFTVDMGINDVRITTRYEGFDFKRSMFSVVHEFGHALYNLQLDPAISYTPLASGVSLGVHEGQSRFWENIIGRSIEFAEFVYQILRESLEFVSRYSPEDLYYYFNTVKPSLIRVDADEVTYNIHIIIRTELEKLILGGEVKVSDLPELWSTYMEELLGVKPSSHAEGVLQDIHWSQGSIGYFPTYTLGNIVAASIRDNIARDLNLGESVLNGNYKVIREWLREKIHKYGATYPPKVLLQKALGVGYEPENFIKYIMSKYLA
ncbi:MAG: carboxypeptidase M32 [Desulfurococcaceae archaeon]